MTKIAPNGATVHITCVEEVSREPKPEPEPTEFEIKDEVRLNSLHPYASQLDRKGHWYEIGGG